MDAGNVSEPRAVATGSIDAMVWLIPSLPLAVLTRCIGSMRIAQIKPDPGFAFIPRAAGLECGRNPDSPGATSRNSAAHSKVFLLPAPRSQTSHCYSTLSARYSRPWNCRPDPAFWAL